MAYKSVLSPSEARLRLRDPSGRRWARPIRAGWRARVDALQRLPAKGLDPRFAAEAVLSIDDFGLIASRLRSIPPAVIREVLALLEERDDRVAPAFFLREAVSRSASDSGVAREWTAALAAIDSLDGVYWGSKKHKARIQTIARQPRLVGAMQAAVGACEEPDRGMLAVISALGDDASIDALIPHFDRAQGARSSLLEQLHGLESFAANTSGMRAFFERIRSAVRVRNATSPTLAMARSLGLEIERIELVARVRSLERVARGQHPRFALELEFTSQSWPFLKLRLDTFEGGFQAQGRWSEEWTSEDKFKLGACQPPDLPVWLARTEKRLRVKWDPDLKMSGSLKGEEPLIFAAWLLSESSAAR